MTKASIPAIDIEKYGGKQVALLDGEVVAQGENLEEVIFKVRQTRPERSLHDVEFLIVPRSLSVLYYANRFPLRNIVL
ncbi:hypothetical protein HY623_02225 [Candidatus Uhrbacteria bacterium]|nr:hypothetical protein [Candidatus Uhrbacteria bacterium]